MRNVIEKISAFVKDEEGLTMVEYAVAGGMVAAAGVATFGLLGDQVSRIITYIKDELVKVETPTA